MASSEEDKNVDIAIEVTSYSNIGTYAQNYKIKQEVCPNFEYPWPFMTHIKEKKSL